MATIASQASEALNRADYRTAISLYTQALANLPTAVDYYIKRSTAYQRSAKYKEALNDAETAVALAHQRGKRELIGQAQLRRGISCYLLEQYGDAAFCFGLGKKFLDQKEKSVDMWISKVELVLRDTAKVPEDDFRREVTIKEIPDVKIPTDAPAAAPQAVVQEEKQESKPATTPVPSPKGVVTPRDKIRHEWYQTNTHVVFTLYVKGVPKESSSIEIEDQAISINFPLPNSSDFQYNLDPLFAPIDPTTSTFTILSTKIELKLTKKKPGEKWKTLEGIPLDKGKGRETSSASTFDVPTTPDVHTSPSSVGPTYPTSSRKGPKNWDKVADELAKPDGTTGEGADQDEEGDPVNFFFKKLYKDADPDTKRAMMKSYIESNGTALSTNWAEVGKGKVETSPPEGLVAKKWDE
ncbi:SGS-domain-containing protein [Terfezia boudieri ATCC MYA-4762]|uniref:SGS-domain-containing protein n=1 Tax=Terfezia boudieri ATCC MYA-4762 TaxID=1051890 RepID=A0A3N4LMN7_9PEZI|nr:SGS-domain-containing protein [Terfezia boudieri ATCC MYA-4762]